MMYDVWIRIMHDRLSRTPPRNARAGIAAKKTLQQSCVYRFPILYECVARTYSAHRLYPTYKQCTSLHA